MTTMIQPVFKFKAEELIKDGRLDEKDLTDLLIWLKGENLPQFGKEMMALFYMACQNHLENTKKCVRAYHQTRRDAPELFNDRNLSRSDMIQQLTILQFCVMPKRTPEGHVVILHRLVDSNPLDYQMDVAMKLLFMTLDSSLYEDPPTGLIVLFDMRLVGLRHLTRIKISAVRKFFAYVQDALPLQLKAVHVLNCVWFINKILTMIRPFYKPELLQLLHLHNSDLDMETFYKTCIPKSCLPEDFGGTLPHSNDIHKETWKILENMQDFFNKEQFMRTFVD